MIEFFRVVNFFKASKRKKSNSLSKKRGEHRFQCQSSSLSDLEKRAVGKAENWLEVAPFLFRSSEKKNRFYFFLIFFFFF